MNTNPNPEKPVSAASAPPLDESYCTMIDEDALMNEFTEIKNNFKTTIGNIKSNAAAANKAKPTAPKAIPKAATTKLTDGYLYNGLNWKIIIKHSSSDVNMIRTNILKVLSHKIKTLIVFQDPIINSKEVDLVALIFLTDNIRSNQTNYWRFIIPSEPNCPIIPIVIGEYSTASFSH